MYPENTDYYEIAIDMTAASNRAEYKNVECRIEFFNKKGRSLGGKKVAFTDLTDSLVVGVWNRRYFHIPYPSVAKVSGTNFTWTAIWEKGAAGDPGYLPDYPRAHDPPPETPHELILPNPVLVATYKADEKNIHQIGQKPRSKIVKRVPAKSRHANGG